MGGENPLCSLRIHVAAWRNAIGVAARLPLRRENHALGGAQCQALNASGGRPGRRNVPRDIPRDVQVALRDRAAQLPTIRGMLVTGQALGGLTEYPMSLRIQPIWASRSDM